MNTCVFCKIRDGEIPKEFTYQDNEVMVFPDINPLKPVHLLVMPKKHVKEFVESDSETLEKVMKTVQKMIKENSLDTKGYHLMVNGGGAQLVDHFHIHIVGPIGSKEQAHQVIKELN